MRRIFDDIAGNAQKVADSVLNSLPAGFPRQLVGSVRSAVSKRVALLAGAEADTSP